MLEVNAIGKLYQNNARTIENMKLDVDDGEILAVVDDLGRGKSALQPIFAIDCATTRTVGVNDVMIREPLLYIDLVFHEPRLLDWLKVAENIGFSLLEPDTTTKARGLGQALGKVELSRYGVRWSKELSGVRPNASPSPTHLSPVPVLLA